MKKFALLAATIGSTAAWYILSNKKLRTELGKAKDPESTVKILSRYLGRDASKIGKEVFDLIHSDEIEDNVSKAKEFTGKKLKEAKKLTSEKLDEAKTFIQSDEVQQKVAKAKEFTEEKFSEVKKGFGGFLAKGKKMKDDALKAAKRKIGGE